MMVSPSRDILTIGYFFNALATASIKMGVKVSFSPSLFSKASLTLFLQLTTLVTSTSTKLCTWAEVLTLAVIC